MDFLMCFDTVLGLFVHRSNDPSLDEWLSCTILQEWPKKMADKSMTESQQK